MGGRPLNRRAGRQRVEFNNQIFEAGLFRRVGWLAVNLGGHDLHVFQNLAGATINNLLHMLGGYLAVRRGIDRLLPRGRLFVGGEARERAGDGFRLRNGTNWFQILDSLGSAYQSVCMLSRHAPSGLAIQLKRPKFMPVEPFVSDGQQCVANFDKRLRTGFDSFLARSQAVGFERG